MPRTVTSLLGPSRRPEPQQELALAVLCQAIKDAARPDGRHSAEARAFLAGNPMLGQWCGVAEIDPDLVRDIARKYLDQHARRAARDESER
jgi:hypothetical protein